MLTPPGMPSWRGGGVVSGGGGRRRRLGRRGRLGCRGRRLHGTGVRPGRKCERRREPDERTGCEQPDDDRASPRFHVVSVDTNIDGLFVTTASTPAFSTRSRSSGSSTVHATTAAPRACARRTAAALTSPWCSTSTVARARASSGSTSGGCDRAQRSETAVHDVARARVCRRCRAGHEGKTRRPARPARDARGRAAHRDGTSSPGSARPARAAQARAPPLGGRTAT